MPHHSVVHPHNPRKVKRVLNDAVKFQGRSLNNAILTGPDLQQSLIQHLYRFRNSPRPCLLTLKACSYKWESSRKTNRKFVFCGGSIHELKFSIRKAHLRVEGLFEEQITLRRGQQLTMLTNFRKQHKACRRIYT